MQNPHFPAPIFGIRGVAVVTEAGRTVIMPPPYRHHHALSILDEFVQPDGQGFWCDDNQFRGREDALAYAKQKGFDDTDKGGSPDLLFSEDLW